LLRTGMSDRNVRAPPRLLQALLERSSLRFESDDAQRRQSEFGGVGLIVAFMLGRGNSAHIAEIAPTVYGSIAVKRLGPAAQARKAQAVFVTRDGGQIE